MKKRNAYKVPKELIYFPKKRMHVFRELPVNEQGFILLNLSRHLRQDILDKLKNDEITKFMHYLDPDDATDLLQKMRERRRKKILGDLSENVREKVEYLLKFDPKTAAGMMSLDYVEVNIDSTFEEVSRNIRKHERKTGRVPAVLVVENGFLVGEVRLHRLALHEKSVKINKHISRVSKIRHNQKEEDILRVFRNHPHSKIVVLDEDDSILGVIYSDDILKIIQKHSTISLYDFAGVRREEDILDSAWEKVKHRYKWLIINLGTAFLAASVVGIFVTVAVTVGVSVPLKNGSSFLRGDKVRSRIKTSTAPPPAGYNHRILLGSSISSCSSGSGAIGSGGASMCMGMGSVQAPSSLSAVTIRTRAL